ncbi:MAG: hypothetical protein ABIJ59_20280 [Pseudomonadota bacterium]
MEINSLQGAAAYSNASSATSPVNNTHLRDQNIEASRTDLDTQSARAAQEAFQVTLTQEARNLQSEATTRQESATQAQPQEQAQAQPPEARNNNTISRAIETSQIVNIVA